MKFKIVLLILCFSVGSCVSVDSRFVSDPESVLFVGNSFTYVNDMPGMLKALAVANGKELSVEESTCAGCSLARHARNTRTRKAIAAKDWSVIVFQGQSLEPIDAKEKMILKGKELAALSEDSKLMVYLTWAYQTEGRFVENSRRSSMRSFTSEELKHVYENMQKLLYDGYFELAAEINGEVVAVGSAWEQVNKRYPSMNLYSEDEFHPSKIGSYLAAMVFYKALYGTSPKNFVPELSTQADHEKLKAVVDDV